MQDHIPLKMTERRRIAEDTVKILIDIQCVNQRRSFAKLVSTVKQTALRQELRPYSQG